VILCFKRRFPEKIVLFAYNQTFSPPTFFKLATPLMCC